MFSVDVSNAKSLGRHVRCPLKKTALLMFAAVDVIKEPNLFPAHVTRDL